MARKAKSKRGQNEGSVYQLPDGRWCAIVPAALSPNGKRHSIYGSARKGTNTREAVAKKLAQYLAGENVTVVKPQQHTVETFLKLWLGRITADGELRPKTLESYRYTVESLIVPAIGAVRLQSLEPDHIRHMTRRLETEKRAPRTVRYARSVLGIALGSAVAAKIITRNPASREAMGITRKKKVQRKIQPIASTAIAAMLAKVPKAGDRILLKTIATFGLRIGEALGLTWKNVDLLGKSIHITQAAQRQPKKGDAKSTIDLVDVKTENSRRTLLVNDSLLEELKVHRVAVLEQRIKLGSDWKDHDLVFPSSIGTPRDARNVLRVLHAAQEAAGVEKTSIHRLRHSAATYLLSHGERLETISSILGHSNIAITKEFYAAFEMAQQKAAAKAMERAFDPPAAKPKPRRKVTR